MSRQQRALRERFLEPAINEAATVGDVRSGVLALTLTLATPGSPLAALAATRPEVFANTLRVGGARLSVEQVTAALARGEALETLPSFRFTGGGYGLMGQGRRERGSGAQAMLRETDRFNLSLSLNIDRGRDVAAVMPNGTQRGQDLPAPWVAVVVAILTGRELPAVRSAMRRGVNLFVPERS